MTARAPDHTPIHENPMAEHDVLEDDEIIDIIAAGSMAGEARPDLVYFVRGVTTRNIKIGHSRQAFSRFDAIAVATGDGLELIGVVHGGERLEKRLHAHLKKYRAGGEWFRDEPPVLECIATVMNCNWHVGQAKRRMVAGQR